MILMQKKHVLFISTMALEPWGGSEELWSRSAKLLVQKDVKVSASVHGWPNLHSRILNLSDAGVEVRPRYFGQSPVAKVARQFSEKTALVQDIEKTVGRSHPDLVLISEGAAFPPIELLELCVAKSWRFATIMHANCDQWWVNDELAARYRSALPLAKRCFFVSEANRLLEEKQLGYVFDNAEILRNPVNLEIEGPLPWPSQGPTQQLRMACVARLAPSQKGQDLLIEGLAEPQWRERAWRLALCGAGPNKDCIERLIRRSNLAGRVILEGHVPADQIWRQNHVLIQPSRFEGLPLSIVEAMLCGRPVVATNVGGNAEIIEDDVTGFVAKCASVEGLLEALDRMWENIGSLQEMGQAGTKQIVTRVPKNPVSVFVDKLLTYIHH